MIQIYKKRVDPDTPDNYETYRQGDFICCCNVLVKGKPTGHHGDPVLLAADGWMLVIDPTYNAETHRLSDNDDDFTDNGINAYRRTVALSNEELAANLNVAKEFQRQIVRAAFEAEEVKPIMDFAGRWWNGGLQSSLRLDGGRRLAAETGATSIVFTDIEDIGHDLPLAEAALVVFTVAGAFQTDFYHKQDLMRQIAAAESKAAVTAINW